jgi:hypothetical protein
VVAKSDINAGITCSLSVLTNELAPTVTPQPVIKSAEEIVVMAVTAEIKCL